MRRIADLHPGEAKPTPETRTSLPRLPEPGTLRAIASADEHAAELSLLCDFDDDLAQQATAASSRSGGTPLPQPALFLALAAGYSRPVATFGRAALGPGAPAPGTAADARPPQLKPEGPPSANGISG
jgi:hypothetical protein